MKNKTTKKPPKKGAGGKLNRSEIVQTRLNPKLRFMAEIMARHQRRTLSSLIEGLIEQAAEKYLIPATVSEKAQTDQYLFGKGKHKKLSAKASIDQIWSVEEADRFAGLALFLPHLLTPEEERLWSLIVKIPYFWEHFEINIESKSGKVLDKEWWPLVDYRGLIRENLRQYWSLLQSILDGEGTIEKLKRLRLTIGRAVKRPDYYPYPLKKIDNQKP